MKSMNQGLRIFIVMLCGVAVKDHATDVPDETLTSAPALMGIIERDEFGRQYTSVSSKLEKLRLPDNVLQLVSSPDGKWVYGIFRATASIKVFEPPTFKEVDDIPVPRYPVSLWCDQKHVTVACDESRLIQVLDAVRRTPIKNVVLKDRPDLRPVRLTCAHANGIMTLWEADGNNHMEKYRKVFVYNLNLQGEAQLVLAPWINQINKHYVENAAIESCFPLHGSRLFTQGAFSQIPRGVPRIIDLNTGKPDQAMLFKLFGTRDDIRISFSRCFTTLDEQNIVLPTARLSQEQAFPHWTYLAANDLSHFMFSFPGDAIIQVPEDKMFVSVGDRNPGPSPEPYINYVDSSSGKLLRNIRMIGDGQSTTQFFYNAIYVRGHEMVLGYGYNGSDISMLRCGPVKAAPPTGIVIVNDPPFVTSPEKEYSFTPDCLKTGAIKVKFKLKLPPDGMSIDLENGAVHWKPTKAQIGSWDIQIVARVDGTEILVLKWALEVEP